MIPDKLKYMSPYTPIAGTFEARLDSNESFVTTPKWLSDKIAGALSKLALNRYPDPMAVEVCSLAAQLYNCSPENVTAGNGSDELISIIITTLLAKNSKVVLADPDFSMYRFYAGLQEVSCLSSNRADGVPCVASLIEASVKADMLIFSNPCNPTGQGILKSEVLRLLDNTGCFIVLDEAYMDFWDQSASDLINTYEKLIVLKTCSKAMGLAGIRLGFALAAPQTSYWLKTAKSPYNVSALAQAVGACVLSEQEYILECIETIKLSVQRLGDDLGYLLSDKKNYSVERTHTNFLLLHCPDAKKLHRELLEKSVCVRCVGQYLRITAGSESENKKLLNALMEIII